MLQDKHAVVLLSGGLDSTTMLAMAIRDGFVCHALTFDYGQKQRVEIQAARASARAMGCDHRVVRIDLGSFGGSALTSDAIAVPKTGVVSEASIPVTYVPARNTVFLSYALALAEVVGAFDIFIGANLTDRAGYPDCRPVFLEAFNRLANVATRASVTFAGSFAVHAPLSGMHKREIINRGLMLGVDYAATHSCYDPVQGGACGACEACAVRREGFADAGVDDPTRYASSALPKENLRVVPAAG